MKMAMNSFVMSANGQSGQLDLYEETIVLRRQGFLARIGYGLKKEKIIPIKNIQSVLLKFPGLSPGYIEIRTAVTRQATSDYKEIDSEENIIEFSYRQQHTFTIIKEELERRMSFLSGSEG